MIDLNQVSLALRNSTARSLILLDEFGKGTVSEGLFSSGWNQISRLTAVLNDSHIIFPPNVTLNDNLTVTDGAGLFTGVLKHFISRGDNCPKVLSATHFHDLFEENLLPVSPAIALLHMEVIMTLESGDIVDTSALGSPRSDGGSMEMKLRPGENITFLYR